MQFRSALEPAIKYFLDELQSIIDHFVVFSSPSFDYKKGNYMYSVQIQFSCL